MEWRNFLYGIPLVPFFPRVITIFCFGSATRDLLPEPAADREQHRNLILVLAGFSFTGLLGLAVAPLTATEPTARQQLQHVLQLPTYFLLTSFLFYVFALNLQAYKQTWRHDLLGDAMIDGAALSLLSSIMVIVWDASNNLAFSTLISVFAGSIWITDEIIRTRLTWKIFREKENKKRRKTQMTKREHKSVDDQAEKREERHQPRPPISPPAFPSSGYVRDRDYSIRPELDKLSALSYITCSSCKGVYVKGDEHECP
jgi:hypothetical protein